MCQSYHEAGLGGPHQEFVTRKLIRLIEKSGINFTHIAVTGISGIAVGAIVASRMNKHLAVVRKRNESSNSSNAVESYGLMESYVFIDDLISSGTTLRHVLKSIEDWSGASCSGIFLYHDEARDDSKAVKINGKTLDIPHVSFHGKREWHNGLKDRFGRRLKASDWASNQEKRKEDERKRRSV